MFNHAALQDHLDAYPHAYYTFEADAFDTPSRLSRTIRRNEHQLWDALVPEEVSDFAIAVKNISRLTGKTERQVDTALSGFYRLRQLPVLTELQLKTYRLDMSRIAAIDQALALTSDAEVIAELDEIIAVYLMPTRANQLFPTATQLKRKINDLIKAKLPNVDVDAKPDRPDPPDLGIHHQEGGRSFLEGELPTEVAMVIDKAIQDVVDERGCTHGEALRDLVTGAARPQVVINVYRAHDVENAPAFTFRSGWVNSQVADALEAQAVTVRDMDEVAKKISSAYQTPEDIRAYVAGRDGICRGPGHGISAERIQMDHVVDFSDGGETSHNNLESLCPRCHNIKTDGRMYPIMLNGGDIVWLMEDGTWVSDQPEGPLSAKSKNWVQTFGQRIDQKREYLNAPEVEPEPLPEPESEPETPEEMPF